MTMSDDHCDTGAVAQQAPLQGDTAAQQAVLSERDYARFCSKFSRVESGCWIWQDRLTHGYGEMKTGPLSFRAHRLSWMLVHGPIPHGMFVCHRCDVRSCVNPDHLFLGTNAENLADMAAKGRSCRGDAHHTRRRPIPSRKKPRATMEQIAEALPRVAAGEPYTKVGRDLGIHPVTLSRIARGITRRDITEKK